MLQKSEISRISRCLKNTPKRLPIILKTDASRFFGTLFLIGYTAALYKVYFPPTWNMVFGYFWVAQILKKMMCKNKIGYPITCKNVLSMVYHQKFGLKVVRGSRKGGVVGWPKRHFESLGQPTKGSGTTKIVMIDTAQVQIVKITQLVLTVQAPFKSQYARHSRMCAQEKNRFSSNFHSLKRTSKNG
jgi:hypothetical protein